MSRHSVLTLVLGLTLSAGCVAGELDDGTGTAGSGMGQEMMVWPNGMHLNGMHLNGLAELPSLNGTDAGILNNDYQASRQVMRYVVRCGLGEDQTVDINVQGNTNSWSGELGFAREWIDGPISFSGLRWLSSCLLSRVNGLGLTVQISMRGPSPNLATTSEEEWEFPHREGAFFGDVVQGQFYACQGPALRELGDGVIVDRICTEAGDPCEIRVLGRCEEVCNGFVGTAEAGYYADCAGFGEVVTTYLSERSFLGIYHVDPPRPTETDCDDGDKVCPLVPSTY